MAFFALRALYVAAAIALNKPHFRHYRQCSHGHYTLHRFLRGFPHFLISRLHYQIRLFLIRASWVGLCLCLYQSALLYSLTAIFHFISDKFQSPIANAPMSGLIIITHVIDTHMYHYFVAILIAIVNTSSHSYASKLAAITAHGHFIVWHRLFCNRPR